MAQHVAWRSTGHVLGFGDAIDVLRFEVSDLNQVIKSAAAASTLYEPLLERGGLSPGSEVLPLSCFAVTDVWTPGRLAEGTRYRTYRQIEARVLLTAGYRLWPTESFDDNGPDRRSEVHYDLIVLSGRDLGLAELGGSKQQRAAARERLAPAFRSLLSVLGKPIDLSRPKDA